MGRSRLARLLAHLLLDIDIASRLIKILVAVVSRDTEETLLTILSGSWSNRDIVGN